MKKELREKTEAELHRMLAESRDTARVLRFRIAAKQASNVRELRRERKTIARILTLLSEKKKNA